jgi:putative N6-adenine-specific DNA methylase
MKNTILITTPKGLSSFLAEEVKDLGYPVLWAGATGVETEGSFNDTLKLNMWLRTAHHVLYLIKFFVCKNPDDLYKNVVNLPWETMLSTDTHFAVVSHVDNPTIKDSRFANLKCKDAIVDRIMQRKGRRPDSGSDRTGAVINLFWKNDQCRIYIDTSGEPLSKRGYRKNPMAAPMQETLAASVIKATKWNGAESFVNPMCGSATLAIEAALIAINKAPGLLRDNFGFMHCLLYNNESWNEIKKEAISKIRRPIIAQIIATDNDRIAIEAGRSNAENAGVKDCISFSVNDFKDTKIPTDSKGVILLNPEYGIRLGDEKNLEDTYRSIGSFLKHSCMGYRGFIFTGNTTLIGKVGLKAQRKIPFLSGNIECRLYEYSLYQGSKGEQ